MGLTTLRMWVVTNCSMYQEDDGGHQPVNYVDVKG